MANRSWYRRCFYEATRWISWCTAKLFFRYRSTGRQHWPATGGALVCANHQSYLDPVLVGLACPGRLNYLARQTLFDQPGLRWLIQMLDAIPIDRDGMGLSGLKETLRRLKRGEMVLIFPEGTRTADGALQPLKPGFLAVARRAGVPLLPVGIAGAYEAWPRQAKRPSCGRIRVHVGRPLPADEVAAASDEEVLIRLGKALQECWQTARQS